MVVDKKQEEKLFDLGINESALEILSGNGRGIGSFRGKVHEMETIEVDPEQAYSGTWKSASLKVENHFIFCGNPYIFLKKKIENQADYEVVIVHADRLEYPRKVWNLIEQLRPFWIILAYKSLGVGKYNKRLMEAHGFETIWQECDSEDGIEEKIYIAKNRKCF